MESKKKINLDDCKYIKKKKKKTQTVNTTVVTTRNNYDYDDDDDAYNEYWNRFGSIY